MADATPAPSLTVSERMRVAAQRFKEAAEAATSVEVKTATSVEGATGDPTGSLARVAVALVMAAAASNPVFGATHTPPGGLDSVLPVSFVKVNGQARDVMPSTVVSQLSREVAAALNGPVKAHEVYNYLVTAHGLDWSSMVACYGQGAQSPKASHMVQPLVQEYAAAQDWAQRKAGMTDGWSQMEARFNYMLSSSQDCRKWVPGAETRGQAKVAMKAYVKERAFDAHAGREVARKSVEKSGFTLVPESSPLYKELKDQGAEDFDIFVRHEGDKPVHLYLDHVVDEFGAHAISLNGRESVVLVNATSLLLGGDARSADVTAQSVIAHEMAHIARHMDFGKQVLDAAKVAVELEANLVSAKELLARGFSADELLESHSRLMLQDAMVGLPNALDD